MNFTKLQNIGIVVGLLLISYFLIFFHLDTVPLKGWDESLFGMRMLYMSEHYSVLPSFRAFEGMGHPNHKPPLITIIQVLFYKLLGPDNVELSLRLPSGLCGLAFVWLNLCISKKEFGNYYFGALASLILLTSAAFNRFHVLRSGDHDIFLSFFLYVAVIGAYYFLSSLSATERKYKWLILAFISLYLGFLTKSIVAFFVIPAIILFAIYSKTILPALKDKGVWISIVSLCLGGFGYFYLFEIFIPGFNEALFVDGLGRFQTKMGISQPFNFFFKQMYEWGFTPYVYLLPVGVYYGFKEKMGLVQLMSISALVFLLIISLSESKHNWYSAPIFPMMSFVVAYGMMKLTELIYQKEGQSPRPYLALYLNVILFLAPVCIAINKNYTPELKHLTERYGYVLKHMKKERPEKEFTIFSRDGIPQASFYIGLLNKEYGYKINQEDHLDKISTPLVLICDQNMKDKFVKHYDDANAISTDKNCWFMKINNF